MVTEINGDLLQSTAQVIAHQVNCMGVAGAGLAKQIMDKYPENLHFYLNHCSRFSADYLLGTALFVECTDGKIIANLFGQKRFGRDNKMYTDYGALDTALGFLRKFMDEKGLTSVAFPYKLGCGLGGGDWKVVESILKKRFGDLDCYIYKLAKHGEK